MPEQADIGLVGLAVMGQNLILNMADHGFTVAAYNRTTSKVDDFLAGPARGKSIIGCHTPQALVKSLKTPRRVMMMVKAGAPVQAVAEQMASLLEPGDILIDGGNSLYADTERRIKELEPRNILYVGTGISGGEEGARHGPSIMPGGSPEAWPHVREIFQSIAAKVGPNHDIPCCEWIGTDGSGHYVKMVHNGIEYGDMQLISEAYFILRTLLRLKPNQLSEIFDSWNRGDLDSFLIEITADILQQRDPVNRRKFLIDAVLDTAGQKGTGKWAGVSALHLGIPAPSIGEAVFARFVSALKAEREAAAKILKGPKYAYKGGKKSLIDAVRDALYLSKARRRISISRCA